MSQLVSMRNRIRAIKTIKKITHAMRLISMSNQTKLKRKHEPMTNYVSELSLLFAKLVCSTPEWQNPIFKPTQPNSQELSIIIGSYKGLCGGFNTNISRLFAQETEKNKLDRQTIIAVGKHAIKNIEKTESVNLLYTEPYLHIKNIANITNDIVESITKTAGSHTQIRVYSTIFKSFFVQKPTVTQLAPVTVNTNNVQLPSEGYIWQEEPNQILDAFAQQYLSAQIEYLLFQSLLSEHAARFVSMDASTKNANSLLEITTLEYNKVRQAKITTEITELSSNF